MATSAADDDYVKIPRSVLTSLEIYLIQAIRRLADTPGVETQQLARDGQIQLEDLATSWARHDTRVALWGAGGTRPVLPAPAKAVLSPLTTTSVTETTK